MDYFIPSHIKGRFATSEQKATAEAAGRDVSTVGVPYEFFRGIHHVPAVIADSHEANALGIVPVEEMSDEDWRLLGLDKDVWMEVNRPKPEAANVELPVDSAPKPLVKPVAALSTSLAAPALASTIKAS